MFSTRAVLPFLFLLVLGCGGSQPEQAPSPDRDKITVRVMNRASEPVEISVMYGRTPSSVLGTVRAGVEATFDFYWRAGDLRLVVDYMARRKATSNAIEDLRRGDQLELVIEPLKPPELSRKRP